MDLIDLARYFGALILVLGLMGGAWLTTKRYGVPGIIQRQSLRRLSVVESLMIGSRHKLMLVKRDGTEHLVLMGPQGASLIETGIPAALSAPVPLPEISAAELAMAS
ncbi:MAG TPA: flagellar biosynthetic protein FliO [Rhizomicrobium sp.]